MVEFTVPQPQCRKHSQSVTTNRLRVDLHFTRPTFCLLFRHLFLCFLLFNSREVHDEVVQYLAYEVSLDVALAMKVYPGHQPCELNINYSCCKVPANTINLKMCY